MEKQIEVAVNWWAEQLARGARQDNGDATSNLLVSMLSASMPLASEAQVNVFKRVLTDELRAAMAKHWDESQPQKGGMFRSIYNDYGVDSKLAAAAKVAGIEAQCPPFPMKTCMWIDPDRVAVRNGYGAKEQVLWQAQKALTHGDIYHGGGNA